MAVAIVATGGTGPGVSAPRNLMAVGTGKTFYEYHFDVTFDSSYPTSGENIAASVDADSPWNVMSTVRRIACIDVIAPGGTGGSTAGDVMHGVANVSGKLLLLFLSNSGADMTEATSTGNYSLITIPCIAYGYR